MANPTKAQFNSANSAAVDAVVSSTLPMTDTELKAAYNAVLGSMYTVDPTKKPTIKRITDIEFL